MALSNNQLWATTNAIYVIFLLWITTKGSWSVTLHNILGPSEVRNNSRPFVVLDCEFSLNASERNGMILKWYLNGKTIYQWIPPGHPQGLGAMRGKINLDYDVSPDPWERHRGLYLYAPSIEMSGDYTCKISTMENEVSKTKRMTVYVPPRQIHIHYTKAASVRNGIGSGLHHRNQHHQFEPETEVAAGSRRHREEEVEVEEEETGVNVTCVVDHVYPQPSLVLYHGKGRNRRPVAEVEERVAQYRDKAWQKILFVVLSDKSLLAENIFECELAIPHTSFIKRVKTIYSPKNPTVMASASGSSSPHPPLSRTFHFGWCLVFTTIVVLSIFTVANNDDANSCRENGRLNSVKYVNRSKDMSDDDDGHESKKTRRREKSTADFDRHPISKLTAINSKAILCSKIN